MAKQSKRQLAGSGEALPAGAVGEIISSSLSTGTAAYSGGNTGIFTMATIVLTPGQWLILAEETAYNAARPPGGTTCAGGSDIYDGTNIVILKAQTALWTPVATGGEANLFTVTHCVPYSVPVGTTKTISFRLRCDANSGIPNGASAQNRGYGFLKAVRIA